VIRRAIIALAEGRDAGDLSTLEDETTIAGVQKAVRSNGGASGPHPGHASGVTDPLQRRG
jgi:hypothetical protein